MKKVLILLLVMIFSFPFEKNAVYAQSKATTTMRETTDSLQRALKTAKQDTNRVNILNRLSIFAWGVGKYDTAITLAQNALQLAQKLNYKKGMAEAYTNIGKIYELQGNHQEALKYHTSSLKIEESIRDKKGIAEAYTNIGNIYELQGNHQEALKYYTSSLKIEEFIRDKKGIAGSYRNIGTIYFNQGYYPEALKYSKASLKTSESIRDKKGIAGSYSFIGSINLAQGNYPEALKNLTAALKIAESIGDKGAITDCYKEIGAIYSSQGDKQEALKEYKAALKIDETFGYKARIAVDYINLANIYSNQGNYQEALKNYTAALKIFDSTGVNVGIAPCYTGMGFIHSSQGNYQEALKDYTAALKIFESHRIRGGVANCYIDIGNVYVHLKKAREGKVWLQKGLVLSKEIGMKSTIRNSYSVLARANSALGDYKSAYENYKMAVVYQDSLKNEENTKKITQISMQYEFDKKQLADSLKNMQIRKLAAEKLGKQKTYTAMGAGLAFILLGFSFFIFSNNKKLDKEKKKSESLLLNILPAEVAEELKEKGHADAKQFDQVSVLFTDFVHFTQTSAQLSPHKLVKELNECFTAFDDIIERNGLEKIKTIGDAYMAVCGLPVSDPRHAQRTVQAALEMRDFITERKKLNESAFEIRIGVNSGSVVAGIVGVKKFAYDIWGDTVNTASRMESNGEPGKVNISETTYQLIKDEFNCTSRGKINAKGKGEVEMYFVSGQLKVES